MPETALIPPTRWWHKAENRKVVCTLCPRECHIPEGGRGFCFVRANEGGELVLTTYGRSTGFCIDPIEKKPLNHFLPGTPVLSFGTAGCNLGCKFCQNWDISKSREIERLSEIATPEAIVEAAKKTGCRSVAFTYNDPVIWAEYAIEVAKVARQEGIKTVAVTAGYISPEARGEFYRWMDAANVDLKGFTETFYRKLCQTQLEPVLDTLKYLKRETGVWFELTNLMIPGENDSPEETKAMCDWIVENLGDDVPIHFTAFHPDFKMLDTPATPHETLLRAREIAMAAGIRYAYVGNVHDASGGSTYCPGCGEAVIVRDWYDIGAYRLDGDKCRKCGTAIPGVFDGAGHGDWGRRRQPVKIVSHPKDFVKLGTSAVGSGGWSAEKAEARNARTREAAVAEAIEAQPDPLRSEPAAASAGATAPKIDFTDAQATEILRHARRVVNATVTSEPVEGTLPVDLAGAPAYGIFVTLRRGAQLRSCRGRWGGAGTSEGKGTLGELLDAVARDAATHDPRFPSIVPHELPHLALEISLMHSPEPIAATGEARAEPIKIGTHGLAIAHPRGRGLLLPHVATEAGWDTQTFLDRLCHKAGLEPGAWKDDAAQILAFQARVLAEHAPQPELETRALNAERMRSYFQACEAMLRGEPPSVDDEVLTRVHEEILGLVLQTPTGLTGAAIGGKHSLVTLAQAAAKSLRDMAIQRGSSNESVGRVLLLWQPIRLLAEDYPARHATLANSAVLARSKEKWGLVVPGDARVDKVAEALASIRASVEDWKAGSLRLTAFSVLGFEARRSPAGQNVRQPARAGQFYPGDPEEMRATAARLLAQEPGFERKPYRAVMLPHAGWLYCGETLGKTLARADVPDTVIVLSPKHTPFGAACSVAPHQSWDIPGAAIPIATDVVKRLLELVPDLRAEPDAHRAEHGVEVLLPFLHQMNPAVRVVPIVLGRVPYDATAQIGDALATVVAERRARGERTLLVISSDMNHFASDDENRFLDGLALDAMKTGDPRKLYDTCDKHDISMCGVLPAAAVMQALRKETDSIAPQVVDYSTSAKASGDTSRVVGYAGVVVP